jgi:hypothetical protein
LTAAEWGDSRVVHSAAESDVQLAGLWAAERADSWGVEWAVTTVEWRGELKVVWKAAWTVVLLAAKMVVSMAGNWACSWAGSSDECSEKMKVAGTDFLWVERTVVLWVDKWAAWMAGLTVEQRADEKVCKLVVQWEKHSAETTVFWWADRSVAAWADCLDCVLAESWDVQMAAK